MPPTTTTTTTAAAIRALLLGGMSLTAVASACPDKCAVCRSGGSQAGGVALVGGICQEWCSSFNYCGTADYTARPGGPSVYQDGGTDCTGCVTGYGAGCSGGGCPPNPCLHLSCGSHGECKVENGAAVCKCDDAYVGPLCAQQDLCSDVDCNHGACDAATGSCVCDRAWEGAHCDIPNPCVDSDCGDHGQCDPTTGQCICEKNWFPIPPSTECNNYDVCHGVFCANGRCRDGACSCHEGYFGEQCEHYDPCRLLNCGQHGRCDVSADGSSASCSCQPGYFGENCETHEPCEGVKCNEPHGHCEPRDPNVGEGECKCEPGWSGPHCNVHDMCFDVECDHGTCDPDTGECVCDEPWFGDRCDQNDPCRQLNCGQHGQCEVTNTTTPFCQCDAGYSGYYCDVDACLTLICGSHGQCHAGGCECLGGYSGEHCDVAPADPCSGVACGEHGMCVDGGCSCEPGWCGEQCEQRSIPSAEAAMLSFSSLGGGRATAAGVGGLAMAAIGVALKRRTVQANAGASEGLLAV
jgi:hypothetical protein